MASKLLNKPLSLTVIESEGTYVLLEVKPDNEYDENSKRTDKIVSISYIVVNIDSFEKYRIKVANTKPLIDNAELQKKRNNGEKVFVEFQNPTIKMYRSQTGTYEDSFKADDISFVEFEI